MIPLWQGVLGALGALWYPQVLEAAINPPLLLPCWVDFPTSRQGELHPLQEEKQVYIVMRQCFAHPFVCAVCRFVRLVMIIAVYPSVKTGEISVSIVFIYFQSLSFCTRSGFQQSSEMRDQRSKSHRTLLSVELILHSKTSSHL